MATQSTPPGVYTLRLIPQYWAVVTHDYAASQTHIPIHLVAAGPARVVRTGVVARAALHPARALGLATRQALMAAADAHPIADWRPLPGGATP